MGPPPQPSCGGIRTQACLGIGAAGLSIGAGSTCDGAATRVVYGSHRRTASLTHLADPRNVAGKLRQYHRLGAGTANGFSERGKLGDDAADIPITADHLNKSRLRRAFPGLLKTPLRGEACRTT